MKAARIITLFGGISYVLTALIMLVSPMWFFENIGHFAPFNRHYIGDLGTFILPLGLGLMWAARDVQRYRLMIGVGAGVSILHVSNHIYDAIFTGEVHLHWVIDLPPLLIIAALLAMVYYQAGMSNKESIQPAIS